MRLQAAWALVVVSVDISVPGVVGYDDPLSCQKLLSALL